MGVVMQFIFGLVGLFALIATAVMLLIRYISLSLMLALLPIALVLNIFPNLNIGGSEHPFYKWQHQFTKWVLFYPVAMFFLAIGFTVANPNNLSASLNPLTNIVNMLVVVGIMIGGLIIAQEMGVTGAHMANALASKTIRRMPKNIDWAMKRMRGRGGQSPAEAGAPGAGGAPAARRLDLAAAPHGVPTQTGTFADMYSAEDLAASAPRPTTQAETPTTPAAPPAEPERRAFGDLYTAEDLAASAPGPEATPATTPETPGTTDAGHAPETGGATKHKDSLWSRLVKYSAGSPSTLKILEHGAEEIAGEGADIFEGLMPGKSDDLKTNEEKLAKLRDKLEKLAEKSIDEDYLIILDKLDKDDKAKTDKKMSKVVRKGNERRRDALMNSRDARLERYFSEWNESQKGVEKTIKKVLQHGGQVKPSKLDKAPAPKQELNT
ncbi:MAG: hypothetical protein A3B23_02580 [Candidatus Colwellbacteria bacterium RIFCSPLOWO2_01_FULL_48_10]|nr:MAG: hypothetical protein A3B23_02580 [Candidatus Colwellbacteria bacterium RIFCSPLOWO2_01_FULL_48_10]